MYLQRLYDARLPRRVGIPNRPTRPVMSGGESSCELFVRSRNAVREKGSCTLLLLCKGTEEVPVVQLGWKDAAR
jgi:hypothetical protein